MSFFDSFTGKAQRRDHERSNARAEAFLAEGMAKHDAKSEDAIKQWDILDPYVQQGGQANTMYANALGVNGQAAAQGANSAYFDSPIWQQINDRSQNALMRYHNARGGVGSGAALAAGSDTAYKNYGNWLSQLQGLGQQGGQYATTQAGARSGIRQGQADTAFNYGATRAGNAINYGNALAQTRGIGVNNLMGLVGLGTNAYTAFKGVPKVGSV